VSKPYRACNCRAAATTDDAGKRVPGKLLGKNCPKLKSDSHHGQWYAKYEAPPAADGKRRQIRVGPYDSEKATIAALATVLGRSGKHADDASTKLGDYLTSWLELKRADLKPRTWDSYREAVELYFRPGLGHIKLGNLKESDIRELHIAMRKISRAEDGTEMLRRLLAARSTRYGRRYSTRPLTDARIRRIHAVLRAALNDASIPHNPAARAKLGKVRRTRPLLWTQARTRHWELTGEVPSAVMVWSREQAGQFLDHVETDRLAALWRVVALYGPRRGELVGLRWADLDLATRRMHIRGDVKSDDSDRVITLDAGTVEVLRDWQGKQLLESLEWGDAWTDSGRVFTREDGRPLRDEWVSDRFASLSRRACQPPVRFHDLRHGALSMALAAGVPLKVVSEIAGHATSAFTADQYVTVMDEMAEAAADMIGSFVPRKNPARVSIESAKGEDDV
jgi:integrase